ncbi:hypothetical protein VP1G_03679 [Cytospora mali]|uniref:Uncharacterized protein n=1 Tax=Cytospora mali TaxID=578113 RepID=A0A194UXF0_CYTMA|nr:hypothetical protein VP1G_03679 [Valsa mali var. pyri (nom. inval.)]
MSNLNLPGAPPPDYAPSESSMEEDYGRDSNPDANVPAFRNLPSLDRLEQEINSSLPGVPSLSSMGALVVNGKHYKFIPEWSNRFKDPVAPGSFRRPAILPGDGNPSTYARRFGIDVGDPPDNPGRSMLTPISDVYPDATQVPNWVEEFQSFVFGGYTAEEGNNVLWDAMQPALRLASKVLESNPPFWQALFDLYNRRPIEDRLVPEKMETGISLTSVWLDVDENKMYPEARELRNRRFDTAGTTAYVLEKFLRLGFEDCLHVGDGISGLTNIIRRYDQPQGRHVVSVRIAPQMVWPLLVPEYSAAEKTAASMHIASTLLHELSDEPQAEEGYAFENTLTSNGKLWGGELEYLTSEHGLDKDDGFPATINVSMTSWPHAKIQPHPKTVKTPPKPSSDKSSDKRRDEIFDYYEEDDGDDDDDYMVNNMNAMTNDFSTIGIGEIPTIGVDESRDKDNNKKLWPDWIMEPPSTTIKRNTALPVSMYSRFFNESFWTRGGTGTFAKYGHQALRMPRDQWEGKPLKSHFEFYYVRTSDVARAFGNLKAYLWMAHATSALEEASEYAISQYLQDLTESVVEADMMRKRLHNEKKMWPRSDAEISKRIEQIRRLWGQVPNLLNNYRQSQGGQVGPGVPPVGNARAAYIEQGCLIIIEVTEVQRLLGIEVQCLQFLVFGVLKQTDETRRNLRRYMNIMRYRIQDVLGRWADEAIQRTSAMYQQYLAEVGPNLPQQMDDKQRQLTDRLTTMYHDIQSTLPSTRGQLSELAEIITVCIDTDESGNMASPPQDRFNLLVDAAGLRAMRTRQRHLRNLAVRNIGRLAPGSPKLKIVQAWLQALRTQPQLAGAATQAEYLAARRHIMGALMNPQLAGE